MSICRTR